MHETQHGFLLTLEGGEGGGKSTQIVRLREKLETAGYDVIVLREPGGTVISEQIRDVVLSAKNTGIAYTTEVLLFQAARAQIYREIVLPSLQAGKIVVMDRSRDSSVVYQGVVRGFGRELIDQLNDISTKNTLPDLTLLLDLPVEVGLQRRAESDKQDRLDMEGAEFHHKVRQAYLDLAQSEPKRWVTIDAAKSLEEVEQEIWKQVEPRLPAQV